MGLSGWTFRSLQLRSRKASSSKLKRSQPKEKAKHPQQEMDGSKAERMQDGGLNLRKGKNGGPTPSAKEAKEVKEEKERAKAEEATAPSVMIQGTGK